MSCVPSWFNKRNFALLRLFVRNPTSSQEYSRSYVCLGLFARPVHSRSCGRRLQDHARRGLRPQSGHGTHVRRHPTRRSRIGAGVLFMVSGGWVSFWVPPETFVGPSRSETLSISANCRHGYTLFIVPARQFAAIQGARSGGRCAARVRLHSSECRQNTKSIPIDSACAAAAPAVTCR